MLTVSQNYLIINFCSLIFELIDPGREKFHFFFTLRDTPIDFINVNCWGSENYIDSLAKSFRINDIGKKNISQTLKFKLRKEIFNPKSLLNVKE